MNTPVRLNKKISKEDEIESWVLSHAHIFLPLCIILLLILFVALMYAVVGVSAVESGNYYNQFDKVI